MDGHQSETEARVTIDLPTARIDAHTHFIPLKFQATQPAQEIASR